MNQLPSCCVQFSSRIRKSGECEWQVTKPLTLWYETLKSVRSDDKDIYNM